MFSRHFLLLGNLHWNVCRCRQESCGCFSRRLLGSGYGAGPAGPLAETIDCGTPETCCHFRLAARVHLDGELLAIALATEQER
jgi:hypothetical protein